MKNNGGKFITFEGIDGCGKTTQINLLKEYLLTNGYEVLVTREPGARGLGEKFREILLNYDGEVSQRCESFLFLADRAQHVDTIVKPALNDGKIVLCDRHTDSTIAYQGYGRMLDITQIKALNELAVNGLHPDLTIVFDIDVETSRQRIGKIKDRMESIGDDFLNRVRLGYIEIADSNPSRIKVINATPPKEIIYAQMLEYVENLLGLNY